jgi:hypothetical protein
MQMTQEPFEHLELLEKQIRKWIRQFSKWVFMSIQTICMLLFQLTLDLVLVPFLICAKSYKESGTEKDVTKMQGYSTFVFAIFP